MRKVRLRVIKWFSKCLHMYLVKYTQLCIRKGQLLLLLSEKQEIHVFEQQ